jgi:glycosyltransferase involved in cell wall biosynthesis
VLSFADALARRRYDVLHVHATGPALFSVLPRLFRQPVVATVHGEDWRREKWGPMARTVLRGGLRIAATVPDRTIVVSGELQRQLQASFGTGSVCIPNGVDPSRFELTTPVAGLEPGRFLLFLGRLVPEKGIHLLLRAFARTDLPHKLVVAGPGTHSSGYVDELRALAAADPRVMLTGPMYGPEKSWLLRNARLMVQPSTLEGMPIVLLEAAVCGCPCLVSDIPEHLEVVRSGGESLASIFRSGDEEALLSALTRAAGSPDEIRTETFRARVLDRYRWSSIAAATEQVYYEALRPALRPAA